MGFDPVTLMAISAGVSVAAGAVGTGMSMYSQNEQAKTAERMAGYNAAIQRQDAEMQMRLAQYQAGANAQIAQAQAQAQINNAQSLANQTLGVEAQQREQARRQREEKERLLSFQRARYAKAGVVAEGSPLVLLSETAQLADLNIQDRQYQDELQRQSLFRQAELVRYDAGSSLLEADQQRYRSLAAQTGQRIRNREADFTLLSGRASASAYRAAAGASLISGLGSVAGNSLDYAYKLVPAKAPASRATP